MARDERLVSIGSLTGKQDKELEKGLLVYLNVISVPQLIEFEACPSALVGEISYIWSFWGQFLLIPIQKWSYFKWLLKKNMFMCRAGEEFKRGNGRRRF